EDLYRFRIRHGSAGVRAAKGLSMWRICDRHMWPRRLRFLRRLLPDLGRSLAPAQVAPLGSPSVTLRQKSYEHRYPPNPTLEFVRQVGVDGGRALDAPSTLSIAELGTLCQDGGGLKARR